MTTATRADQQGLEFHPADTHDLIVTLEDSAIAGGAGSAVNEWLARSARATHVLNLGLPDRFLDHGSREQLLADAGLDTAGILAAVRARTGG